MRSPLAQTSHRASPRVPSRSGRRDGRQGDSALKSGRSSRSPCSYNRRVRIEEPGHAPGERASGPRSLRHNAVDVPVGSSQLFDSTDERFGRPLTRTNEARPDSGAQGSARPPLERQRRWRVPDPSDVRCASGLPPASRVPTTCIRQSEGGPRAIHRRRVAWGLAVGSLPTGLALSADSSAPLETRTHLRPDLLSSAPKYRSRSGCGRPVLHSK